MKLIKFTLAVSLSLIFWSCTSEKEPIPKDVDCNTELNITIENENGSNCGQADGGFTVAVTGGSGNYTYQLGTGSAQTSAIFQSLLAGSYTITVTDTGLDCSVEVNVQVRNQDGVNATLASTNSDCDTPSGTIQVTATDGVQPYQYKLNDGSFQSSATFSSIGVGDHTVIVRDASGCEVEIQAQVRSTVTFGQIRTLVQTNCAVSGCHDGTISPDFRNDSNITGRSGRIRARTSARTMPPSSSGRSLSNEEIANIACWVNDGAQGN